MEQYFYPYMMPNGCCSVLEAVDLADAFEWLGATGEQVLFCRIKESHESELWNTNEKRAECIFLKYFDLHSGYITNSL